MELHLAMPDEPMGADCNLMEEDCSQITWDSDEVCAYYMARFCPYDLFASTNNDLGRCNRIHDPKLKQSFEKSPRHDIYLSKFEAELAQRCEELVMELDRRVRRGREPFAQGEEHAPPPSVSVEKFERLSVLEEKLKNLLFQLEALGEDEKVDDTLALVKQEVKERGREEEGLAREKEAVATHTRTIGVIHPPPNIRTIVDKTATFVAKHGPEFEKRILSSNAKVNFLNVSDPYHAYYQHRLSEFHAQNLSPQPILEAGDSDAPQSVPSGFLREGNDLKADPSLRLPPPKVLEPPEAEQYAVRLPEGVTAEELDIVKLTAQFVARNGSAFMNGLNNREMNGLQFHFLKPTHGMFTFFTGFVDAYSKILDPPNGLTEKLGKNVADMTTVLERCLHRLEWEHSQEQERQKAEDEVEQERLQMAMIDWHDFVLVETIDFVDDDEIMEPGKEVEMEMDEEDVTLVEECMRAHSLMESDDDKGTKSNEEPEQPMRIVKNWKRPEERIPTEKDSTKFVVSPITGELIPINEMSEHMRISLIDPKYGEQKERMFAKIRETTLAQDDEISRNIVGIARTRPDIFGTTAEEVSIAVKAEIEKKNDEPPKQVIWDGHTGSIGRTANQAMSQNAMGEDPNEVGYMDSMTLLGPAAPSIFPLPPPHGLALNIPRGPPNTLHYSATIPGPPPMHPGMPMTTAIHPQPPPIMMASGQQHMMVHRPLSMSPSMSVNPPNMVVPPPSRSQFNLMGVPRPYVTLPVLPYLPQGLPSPPPLPVGMPPPPPPEDAPPSLPDEPQQKRQRLDDSMLIPEDKFLAQHLGPARIAISVPNVDEGNLKGQVLEIYVQSLTETVGSLKEMIAGEIQVPANKQKLSGKAGFLKDNMSLAHNNVGAGEMLSLSIRERGGRKR